MSVLSFIDNCQRKIEADTGLCVTRIQTPLQMAAMLDQGLADIYRAVFAEPPYLETFTLDEVRDIFQDFLKERGHVFVLLDPSQKMQPVAFVASLPLAAEFNLAARAGGVLDVKKTAYFAEEGVSAATRRQGLSGRMKALLLDACRADGFRKVLLRTSVNNYRQISAVNKAGGAVIAGMFQDVARRRLDGSVSNDRNAFYLFDLKRGAAVSQLDRVVIMADAAGDRAVVFDPLSDADKRKWNRMIRKTYPGIAAVDFGGRTDVSGKKVFDGRLYVAG